MSQTLNVCILYVWWTAVARDVIVHKQSYNRLTAVSFHKEQWKLSPYSAEPRAGRAGF
jgi:hypothetical protein